jgi:hypothetical protein
MKMPMPIPIAVPVAINTNSDLAAVASFTDTGAGAIAAASHGNAAAVTPFVWFAALASPLTTVATAFTAPLAAFDSSRRTCLIGRGSS